MFKIFQDFSRLFMFYSRSWMIFMKYSRFFKIIHVLFKILNDILLNFIKKNIQVSLMILMNFSRFFKIFHKFSRFFFNIFHILFLFAILPWLNHVFHHTILIIQKCEHFQKSAYNYEYVHPSRIKWIHQLCYL